MEAMNAYLPTLRTSTPQFPCFVDTCYIFALYLIYLVFSNLYTLRNPHLTTTPQNRSGPQISQPQARHSQRFTKKDKRKRIRCLPPLATTPIRDKRKRTSKINLQLLLQHIKSAEHKHHTTGNDMMGLIHPLTTCNIQTNCNKNSNPRTTAPPRTS